MTAVFMRFGGALVATGLVFGLAALPAAPAEASVTIPQPISLYKFDETTGATTIVDSIRGAQNARSD